nr:2-iminobutanoate/2-iminopropanoate deaminase-like isoform X2 [Cherax quadricarinatus]
MASKIIRKVISSPRAPAAIGPYSQAVQAGNTLYISGQLGMNPETLNLVSEDVVAQTETALTNMGYILEAAGCTYKNVFSEAVPARAAYQVANLPKGGRVEIEAVAVVGELDHQ